MKASEYATCYEHILSKPEINGCAVKVSGKQDLDEPNYEKKLG